jgi:hypothetical protein
MGCMGATLRGATRGAPKVGTSLAWCATCVPVCKLAWVLHVEKLGLTSVWAYVGPYSDEHNTRTARGNKSKIKFKKVLTQEQKAI